MTTQPSIERKKYQSPSSRGFLRKNLDYGDWCVYEVFQNPIHFIQFVFPDPQDHTVHLDSYIWDVEHPDFRIWPFQYAFVLWARAVIACGKNIGKSLIGIVLRRIWKSMWGTSWCSVIASPKGQHSERLYQRILQYYENHHLLQFWRYSSSQGRRIGDQSQKSLRFRTRNLWTLQALLPGAKGAGFKGERGNDRTIDECQDLTDAEHMQIRNLLEEPMDVDKGAEDLSFGVPAGNRTAPFYRMDTDDRAYPGFKHFRKKIPCHLPPTMRRDRFIELLDENRCRYEIRGDRVVVIEWSNEAQQTMLGQWGEPAIPCFPTSWYGKVEPDQPFQTYRAFRVTEGMMREDPDLMELDQELYRIGNRFSVQGLDDPKSMVIIAVDPGKSNTAVEIWARRKSHFANYRWWLLGRCLILGVHDGPTQARIVERIAGHWRADVVACDSSAQSSFLSDLLGNADMFPNPPRYYLRDDKVKDYESVQMARAEFEMGKRLVIGINFISKSGIVKAIRGDDIELDQADVMSVYGLQDMALPPQLALPGADLDPDFYNEVTSYSERPKGLVGKRFMPEHPHWVSAMKVFWCAHWLMNLLAVSPSTPQSYDRAVGAFFGT